MLCIESLRLRREQVFGEDGVGGKDGGGVGFGEVFHCGVVGCGGIVDCAFDDLERFGGAGGESVVGFIIWVYEACGFTDINLIFLRRRTHLHRRQISW